MRGGWLGAQTAPLLSSADMYAHLSSSPRLFSAPLALTLKSNDCVCNSFYLRRRQAQME